MKLNLYNFSMDVTIGSNSSISLTFFFACETHFQRSFLNDNLLKDIDTLASRSPLIKTYVFDGATSSVLDIVLSFSLHTDPVTTKVLEKIFLKIKEASEIHSTTDFLLRFIQEYKKEEKSMRRLVIWEEYKIMRDLVKDAFEVFTNNDGEKLFLKNHLEL